MSNINCPALEKASMYINRRLESAQMIAESYPHRSFDGDDSSLWSSSLKRLSCPFPTDATALAFLLHHTKAQIQELFLFGFLEYDSRFDSRKGFLDQVSKVFSKLQPRSLVLMNLDSQLLRFSLASINLDSVQHLGVYPHKSNSPKAYTSKFTLGDKFTLSKLTEICFGQAILSDIGALLAKLEANVVRDVYLPSVAFQEDIGEEEMKSLVTELSKTVEISSSTIHSLTIEDLDSTQHWKIATLSHLFPHVRKLTIKVDAPGNLLLGNSKKEGYLTVDNIEPFRQLCATLQPRNGFGTFSQVNELQVY
jgi:hypothetical protein